LVIVQHIIDDLNASPAGFSILYPANFSGLIDPSARRAERHRPINAPVL
jgi:hypothetical protein